VVNNGQEDIESDGTEKEIPAISRDFTITNQKVIWILATLVVYLGSSYVNSIINNPNTRIDALVDELTHVHKELDDLKYEVAQTQRNDLECDLRNDRQQNDIDMLKKMGGECVNWRHKAEVEIIQLNEFYKWYSHRERIPD